MRHKRIQSKIVLWAGVCLLLTATAIMVFSSFAMRSSAVEAAQENVLTMARGKASEAARILEEAFISAKSLVQALASVKDEDAPLELEREAGIGVMRSFLVGNPDHVGVGTAWEPDEFDAIDGSYVNAADHDATGRYVPFWIRRKTGKPEVIPMPNYANTGKNAYYQEPKQTNLPYLSEPWIGPSKESYRATISLPIMSGQKFCGIVRVDTDLSAIQRILERSKAANPDLRIEVFSRDGLVVASTMDALLGTSHPALENGGEPFRAAMRAGEQYRYGTDDRLAILTPVRVGTVPHPWFVHVSLPHSAVTADATSAMIKNLGIAMVFIVIGLLVLSGVANRLARPIRATARHLEEIARGDGDLTRTLAVGSEDEIGRLAANFNDFVATVHDVVVDVRTAADTLSAGTDQIAAAGAETSHTAESQANKLADIARAVSKIKSKANESSDNSRHARDVFGDANQACDLGATKMADLCAAMEEIKASAVEVSGVLRVIEDIATQSNLLALNASVEAARAGVAGRGFGVVAEEVRGMALRSSKAAADSSNLIEHSLHRAEQGAVMAKEVGEILASIFAKFDTANELVFGISSASENQLQMISTVALNTASLDSITQHHAERSRELAAAAQENSECMETMWRLVDKFKVRSGRIGDQD